MRDLPFATTDESAVTLDVETAMLSFPLRAGASLDEAALRTALKKAGFGLGSVRVAGAADAPATGDADAQ